MRKPTLHRPLTGGAGIAAIAGLAMLGSTGLAIAGTVTLNFGQTTTGGIPDASGNGTPFTVRLPGTGSYLAGANDPYLSLNTSQATLSMTTPPQPTDFYGASEPGYIDAPGIDLASIGFAGGHGQDISVTGTFQIPSLSTLHNFDQFVVYVGDGFNGSNIANPSGTSDANAGLAVGGLIYGIQAGAMQAFDGTNVGLAQPTTNSFDGAGNANMQVAGTTVTYTIYRNLGAWGAYYTLPSTSGTGTTTYAANFNGGQSPLLDGASNISKDLYAGIAVANSGLDSVGGWTVPVGGFTASVNAAPTFAAAQVVHDWNGGSGNVNDGAGGANGTLESGATVSNGKIVLVNNANNVLTQQPGAAQYVQLPGSILPTSGQALTVQSWFTAATTDSSGGTNINWERVFDFGNNSGGNPTSTFFFTPHSSFAKNVAVAGLWGAPSIVGTTNLADGTLHMVDVSLAQDGSNLVMQLYVDGQFVGSTSAANMSLSSIDNTLNYLGRSQFNGDAYFNGTISDFSIYNSLLSGSQIASNFAAGVPAPVPEPASLALFGAAGAAMLLVRRKRKA